jgi:hypothetical protein
VNRFGCEPESRWHRDSAFEAFFRMIIPERLQEEREHFFHRIRNRIAGVALAKDSVIPYHGVELAMGKENTEKTIQLLDFAFPYSHENPFPVTTKDISSLTRSFTDVFSRAAGFLA